MWFGKNNPSDFYTVFYFMLIKAYFLVLKLKFKMPYKGDYFSHNFQLNLLHPI